MLAIASGVHEDCALRGKIPSVWRCGAELDVGVVAGVTVLGVEVDSLIGGKTWVGRTAAGITLAVICTGPPWLLG